MANTIPDQLIRHAAQICYEAERQYNRIHGRLDQYSWQDLTELEQDDAMQRVTVLYNGAYENQQLSKPLQIWDALVKVLLQRHNQD